MAEKDRIAKAETDRIYWNAFAAFRLGAGAQRAVLTYFGSAAEAVLAREKEWQRFFGLAQKLSFTAAEIGRVREVRQRNHEEELRTIEGRGIRFVTEGEEDFPERLRSLYDAPHWLYYLGTLPEESPQMAIVGARRCTPYGGAVARGLQGSFQRMASVFCRDWPTAWIRKRTTERLQEAEKPMRCLAAAWMSVIRKAAVRPMSGFYPRAAGFCPSIRQEPRRLAACFRKGTGLSQGFRTGF